MNVAYMRARKRAQEAIKKYGCKFHYQDMGQGYVTWDSDLITWDEEPPFVYMVVFPPGDSLLDEFGAEAGGIMDLSMYRKFLMSTEGMSVRPAPQHEVAYQGDWWTIKTAVNLNPDGKVDILYKGILQRI